MDDIKPVVEKKDLIDTVKFLVPVKERKNKLLIRLKQYNSYISSKKIVDAELKDKIFKAIDNYTQHGYNLDYIKNSINNNKKISLEDFKRLNENYKNINTSNSFNKSIIDMVVHSKRSI